MKQQGLHARLSNAFLLAFAVLFTACGHGSPSADQPTAKRETGKPQATAKPETSTIRVEVRNVIYRFADNVSVHIKSLTGSLVPVADYAFPVIDDKNSFRVRIDAGEIAMAPADLANVLNSYVFARPQTPLAGISMSIDKGKLKVKGKLHDKGDMPFETAGTLSPTPDGKVRLHSEKVSTLHVPVKGLMDAFGIEVDDLIKNGKVPGMRSEENDLIFDLGQIMLPPHIDGKVTAIRIDSDAIVPIFGAETHKSSTEPVNESFIALQGKLLRVGSATLADADIIVSDLDPHDPLDFYLDHYKDQLAAGYTKVSPTLQIRAFLKDYSKLNTAAAKPAPTPQPTPKDSGK